MSGKAKDLTNQRFGHWTVLYRVPSKTYGNTLWRCRCDCGTERDVLGNTLKSGQSKSCGCVAKIKAKGRQDLTNQRFDKLVALYPIENSYDVNYGYRWVCKCDCGNTINMFSRALQNTKHNHSCGKCNKIKSGDKHNRLTAIKYIGKRNRQDLWMFKCDCGNEHIAIARQVQTGNIKSCGCLLTEILESRAIDLSGKRFGKLVAIKRLEERNKDGDVLWECLCDCGEITKVRTYHLTTGAVQSCGCLSSKGELKIKEILEDNSISYVKQMKFDDCRFEDTGYYAKFDFYIDNKYIVEFDGEQHFKECYEKGNVNSNWQSYEYILSHDMFKNAYCLSHNIPIIRIPYTHLKDLRLEDLMPETSKFLVA